MAKAAQARVRELETQVSSLTADLEAVRAQLVKSEAVRTRQKQYLDAFKEQAVNTTQLIKQFQQVKEDHGQLQQQHAQLQQELEKERQRTRAQPSAAAGASPPADAAAAAVTATGAHHREELKRLSDELSKARQELQAERAARQRAEQHQRQDQQRRQPQHSTATSAPAPAPAPGTGAACSGQAAGSQGDRPAAPAPHQPLAAAAAAAADEQGFALQVQQLQRTVADLRSELQAAGQQQADLRVSKAEQQRLAALLAEAAAARDASVQEAMGMREQLDALKAHLLRLEATVSQHGAQLGSSSKQLLDVAAQQRALHQAHGEQQKALARDRRQLQQLQGTVEAHDGALHELRQALQGVHGGLDAGRNAYEAVAYMQQVWQLLAAGPPPRGPGPVVPVPLLGPGLGPGQGALHGTAPRPPDNRAAVHALAAARGGTQILGAAGPGVAALHSSQQQERPAGGHFGHQRDGGGAAGDVALPGRQRMDIADGGPGREGGVDMEELFGPEALDGPMGHPGSGQAPADVGEPSEDDEAVLADHRSSKRARLEGPTRPVPAAAAGAQAAPGAGGLLPALAQHASPGGSGAAARDVLHQQGLPAALQPPKRGRGRPAKVRAAEDYIEPLLAKAFAFEKAVARSAAAAARKAHEALAAGSVALPAMAAALCNALLACCLAAPACAHALHGEGSAESTGGGGGDTAGDGEAQHGAGATPADPEQACLTWWMRPDALQRMAQPALLRLCWELDQLMVGPRCGVQPGTGSAAAAERDGPAEAAAGQPQPQQPCGGPMGAVLAQLLTEAACPHAHLAAAACEGAAAAAATASAGPSGRPTLQLSVSLTERCAAAHSLGRLYRQCGDVTGWRGALLDLLHVFLDGGAAASLLPLACLVSAWPAALEPLPPPALHPTSAGDGGAAAAAAGPSPRGMGAVRQEQLAADPLACTSACVLRLVCTRRLRGHAAERHPHRHQHAFSHGGHAEDALEQRAAQIVLQALGSLGCAPRAAAAGSEPQGPAPALSPQQAAAEDLAGLATGLLGVLRSAAACSVAHEADDGRHGGLGEAPGAGAEAPAADGTLVASLHQALQLACRVLSFGVVFERVVRPLCASLGQPAARDAGGVGRAAASDEAGGGSQHWGVPAGLAGLVADLCSQALLQPSPRPDDVLAQGGDAPVLPAPDGAGGTATAHVAAADGGEHAAAVHVACLAACSALCALLPEVAADARAGDASGAGDVSDPWVSTAAQAGVACAALRLVVLLVQRSPLGDPQAALQACEGALLRVSAWVRHSGFDVGLLPPEVQHAAQALLLGSN